MKKSRVWTSSFLIGAAVLAGTLERPGSDTTGTRAASRYHGGQYQQE